MTNGDAGAKENAAAEVHSTRSFKIPAFWRSNPELWFRQIESQFYTFRITSDSTKYHNVVAAMESEVLQHVSDIIISPPTSDMYEALKRRLIERFSDSEELRLKKLLSDIELGDQRPSHLLAEMRELASGKVSDELLKTLWLQRLPTQVKIILTASGDSLVNLACMADKIMEVAGVSKDNFGCIASTDISRTRSFPSTNTDTPFEKLEKQIAALTLKVEKLTNNRERSRSRNNHRSVSGTSRARNGDKVNHELCWYHFKFGDKATKCREPCKFESSSGN
ncbi:uncharacterized protein LOC111034568 [Myzus persicae]|uniref:uncharacterized protein LOC111034568 n=1 Tax=Myzus persicae TaxID=13164 RepID=UPI000B930793|nr:uncharacterized protein LOC111034568 [Myzus persicae]